VSISGEVLGFPIPAIAARERSPLPPGIPPHFTPLTPQVTPFHPRLETIVTPPHPKIGVTALQMPKAARRKDRRASNCHPERAVQPGVKDPNRHSRPFWLNADGRNCLSPFLAKKVIFGLLGADSHDHNLSLSFAWNKARNSSCPLSRAEKFLP